VTHRPTYVQIAVASALTLVLLAITAIPSAAAEPKRRAGAEDVAFRLVNCLRTGGFVTRAGTCKAKGTGKYSRYVKPLRRSRKIANKVAWPWARKSVQFYGARRCWIGHSRNGSTVDTRFASASLRHVANGENMGCGLYGTARATTIRLVRLWQSEKRYRGPHWRQIKDRDFRSLGVGVAKYGQRKAQVVVNFYGKVPY
jgi:hypothetical protein